MIRLRVPEMLHDTAISLTKFVLAATPEVALAFQLNRESRNDTRGERPRLHFGSTGCCYLVGWILFFF